MGSKPTAAHRHRLGMLTRRKRTNQEGGDHEFHTVARRVSEGLGVKRSVGWASRLSLPIERLARLTGWKPIPRVPHRLVATLYDGRPARRALTHEQEVQRKQHSRTFQQIERGRRGFLLRRDPASVWPGHNGFLRITNRSRTNRWRISDAGCSPTVPLRPSPPAVPRPRPPESAPSASR
jgi:hypothetical protein